MMAISLNRRMWHVNIDLKTLTYKSVFYVYLKSDTFEGKFMTLKNLEPREIYEK